MTVFEPIIPDDQREAYDSSHYAPMVRAGDLVFCSGIMGASPEWELSEDPATQFALLFENMERLLSAARGTLRNVVEMTSFHIDINTHIATFMEVKDRYLTEPYPAWTGVGVAELGMPGSLVEVRVVARMGRD